MTLWESQRTSWQLWASIGSFPLVANAYAVLETKGCPVLLAEFVEQEKPQLHNHMKTLLKDAATAGTESVSKRRKEVEHTRKTFSFSHTYTFVKVVLFFFRFDQVC